MFLSFNPYNQVLVRRYDSHSDEQLTDSCTRASQVFRDWRKRSVSERAECVLRFAALLEQSRDAVAAMITTEMGKPFAQAKAEIEKSVWLCRHYAERAPKILAADKISIADKGRAYVRKEALGAILGVMPWNFPVWQSLRFAIPAILAGNVVLLKPASNTPQCGLELQRLFEEAGMKDVLQAVLAEIPQLELLLSNPVVQGATLTGSDRAGAGLASLAGKYIKKCMLELGGTDPFIVLADADIAKAARMAVRSRFNNSGQTCIAAKRWIMEKSAAPAFLEAAKQEIANLKIGDPFDPATNLSCLARIDLAESLEKQVSESLKMGARIILEGGRQDTKSSFFYPCILGDVKPGMPAYDQELFGPVAAVIEVADAEEAVRVANDSAYGLGASIWTKNKKRGEEIALQIDCGTAVINDMVISDPRMPFGGIKRSGFGRELGDAGLLEFVNLKTILISKG